MSETPRDTLFAGRYRIERCLGQGGMGSVMLATDVELNRQVAIKLLHPIADDLLLERFRREGLHLAALAHPNLLKVFDVGVQQGHPFLVTEFLEGGTLRQRLRAAPPLTPREAVQIMRASLAGLEALHEHGLIHRDLKPENILFDAQGQPRIVDLGIVHDDGTLTKLTQTGAIVGTPRYLAPEQAIAEAPQPATDVYSMGVILHELITGQPLFQGSTPAALLAMHVHDIPPRLDVVIPDLPAGLADCVGRALEKEPARRFQSAREFADALGSIRFEPAEATPAPRAPSPPRKRRTSKELGVTSSHSDAGSGKDRVPRGSARAPLAALLAAVVVVALMSLRPVSREPQLEATGAPPAQPSVLASGRVPSWELRCESLLARVERKGAVDAVSTFAAALAEWRSDGAMRAPLGADTRDRIIDAMRARAEDLSEDLQALYERSNQFETAVFTHDKVTEKRFVDICEVALTLAEDLRRAGAPGSERRFARLLSVLLKNCFRLLAPARHKSLHATIDSWRHSDPKLWWAHLVEGSWLRVVGDHWQSAQLRMRALDAFEWEYARPGSKHLSDPETTRTWYFILENAYVAFKRANDGVGMKLIGSRHRRDVQRFAPLPADEPLKKAFLAQVKGADADLTRSVTETQASSRSAALTLPSTTERVH